jgi:hypothetical protein
MSALLPLINPARRTAKGRAVSLLDPLGIFDGGGSSASVSSTVNLDIQGLDKIGVTESIDIKPLTLNENIDIKPLTVNETIDVKPLTLNENIDLKPVTLNENIDLKPVTLNENIDLKPVTLNENIDLKPVAVDTCQTLRLAPLPETKVRSPYHHHVALCIFGVELMAMTFTGESEQEIRSPNRPQVTGRTRYPERGHGIAPTVLGQGQGIRVRVLDGNDD